LSIPNTLRKSCNIGNFSWGTDKVTCGIVAGFVENKQLLCHSIAPHIKILKF
jgi:hypothetical protein